MSINDRVIEVARGLVGVQAGDPATHARFVEILGIPASSVGWEPMLSEPFSMTTAPDGRISTTGVSTCALVARGILREAGVLDPSFEQPYVTASGLSSLVELARRNGALHQNDGYAPVPGDVCIVNNGGHVCTIVDDMGGSYRSVDGGIPGVQNLQSIDIREGYVRDKSLIPSWIVIETARLPHTAVGSSDAGIGVLLMFAVAASVYWAAKKFAPRVFKANTRYRPNTSRLAQPCFLCGGAAHPASGCQYKDGTLMCGPCTRDAWAWILKHQKRMTRVGGKGSKRFINFYDYVNKVSK